MMSKTVPYFYALSILIFLFTAILLGQHYAGIPDMVTTHVDMLGEENRRGEKVHLVYALLANAVLLLFTLFFIAKPQYANYPFEISDENRSSSYRNMQVFLSIVCVLMTIVFTSMILKAIDATFLSKYISAFSAFYGIVVWYFSRRSNKP